MVESLVLESQMETMALTEGVAEPQEVGPALIMASWRMGGKCDVLLHRVLGLGPDSKQPPPEQGTVQASEAVTRCHPAIGSDGAIGSG